jgi:hypothetical protein
MSVQKILKHAKEAKDILDRKDIKSIHGKLKWFHIRPTSYGITLVSTHEKRKMRGISEVAISKLEDFLKTTAGAVDGDAIDWAKIIYNGRVFIERTPESENRKREKEFRHQANFINEIVNNSKAFPKISEELFFIGSEVILQEGTTQDRKRIDVVAHDGNGKVLFFEIKSEDNKQDNPKEQIEAYINRYKNDKYFKELLMCYPTTIPIDTKINSFEGWVVKGNEKSKLLTFEKVL